MLSDCATVVTANAAALQGYVKSVNLSHVNHEVHSTIQDNLARCVNRGKNLVSIYVSKDGICVNTFAT